MGRICWRARPDGWYTIDIALGPFPTALNYDSGIVDAAEEVGFDLDPVLWDRLLHAGVYTGFRRRVRRDASGHSLTVDSGLLTAQLADPGSRLPVGPAVQVYASRGALGPPSRVGVVFFHKLTGCHVDWDLDARTWCVQYP